MKKVKIEVCIGSSCFVKGNAQNVNLIENFLKKRGRSAEDSIDLSGIPCSSCCGDGPIVFADGQRYTRVDAEKMTDILNRLFPGKK